MIHKLEGHTGEVTSVCLYAEHTEGRLRIVTGSQDRTIKVWDAREGNLLHSINFVHVRDGGGTVVIGSGL